MQSEAGVHHAPSPWLAFEHATLDRECYAVLHAIAQPLHGLLQVNALESSRLKTAIPKLTLHLDRVAQSRPSMLQAFATLMSYSYRLNAFPALKRKFWKWVLRSSMTKWNENTSPRWNRIEEDDGESDDDDLDNYEADRWSGEIYRTEPWMLEEPDTACFAISIDLRDTTSSGKMLTFDAVLLRLMKTAPASTRHCASTTNRIATFDCSPVLWKPTANTLESLEACLDQVYKHPDRQCKINMLNMSSATGKSATYPRGDVGSYRHKIIFGGRPRKRRFPPESTFDVVLPLNATSSLRHAHLGGEAFGVRQFAIICSALRYECRLEELSFVGTLQSMAPDERTKCWQWLAFGLFYPRSRYLARKHAFRLYKIDLSGAVIDPVDAEAIRRTLLNPAELIFPGRQKQEGAVRALMVCCVVRGAAFYERPDTTLTVSVSIFRTEAETEFEALCDKDEWVCVVVPGFGVGWNVRRYELMLRTHNERKSSRPGYRTFLECVGAQLNGLDLSEFGELRDETSDVLHAIVTHYVHLKHLVLKGCGSVDEKQVAPLLTALRGNLGSTIEPLNLNGSFTVHETLEQLAHILSNTEEPPALQELRLDGELDECFGHECLLDALHANKILAILELSAPDEHFSMFEGEINGFDDTFMRVR